MITPEQASNFLRTRALEELDEIADLIDSMAPRLELGEPVDRHDMQTGVMYLADIDGELRPAWMTVGGYSRYMSADGYIREIVDERAIYRDPRPLPFLPKREPTLREKLHSEFNQIRNGKSLSAAERDLFAIPEIAALLEKQDE